LSLPCGLVACGLTPAVGGDAATATIDGLAMPSRSCADGGGALVFERSDGGRATPAPPAPGAPLLPDGLPGPRSDGKPRGFGR